MSRDSYDDFDRRGSGGGGGKTLRLGLVLAILIMIILVCIILYLFLSGDEEDVPSAPETASVEVMTGEDRGKGEEDEDDAVEIIVTPAAPTALTPIVTPSQNVARDISSVSSAANTNVVSYVDYTLGQGENLESVSSSFGLKSSTLISVNKIRNISAVTEGATIRIPNMDGTLYTVQEGDSLSLITSRFNPGLGYERLQEVNGLKNSVIYVGQEIFIPSPAESSQTAATVSAVSFSPPLSGSITTTYQERVGGVTINGIGISAPVGSEVTSSAFGIVIEISNLDAGRFVRIQHDENYQTVYGPFESVSVNVGDEVTEGQIIGTLGANPITSPSLFFSVEQSGISLDPTYFI